jgi:hypothetical protein
VRKVLFIFLFLVGGCTTLNIPRLDSQKDDGKVYSMPEQNTRSIPEDERVYGF